MLDLLTASGATKKTLFKHKAVLIVRDMLIDIYMDIDILINHNIQIMNSHFGMGVLL